MQPRFSIKWLFGLVAIAALEVSALRSRTEVSAACALFLTILSLAFGLLGSLFCQGSRRGYWIGFTLFGTAYLLAALFSPRPQAFLPTAWLLEQVELRVHPPVPEYAVIEPSMRYPLAAGTFESVKAELKDMQKRWRSGDRDMYDPTGLTVTYRSADIATEEEHGFFFRVGHALFALLLASLGGFGAAYFWSTASCERGGTEPAP